ncbi:hypothetical protein RCO48_03810 [Peribacillus frigoritolerans]|nr:hypothetical protein [Peribacillus frigoritolerans]
MKNFSFKSAPSGTSSLKMRIAAGTIIMIKMKAKNEQGTSPTTELNHKSSQRIKK